MLTGYTSANEVLTENCARVCACECVLTSSYSNIMEGVFPVVSKPWCFDGTYLKAHFDAVDHHGGQCLRIHILCNHHQWLVLSVGQLQCRNDGLDV